MQERQADTAFWPTALHGGRNPLVPVAGQLKEARITGLALRPPQAVGVHRRRHHAGGAVRTTTFNTLLRKHRP